MEEDNLEMLEGGLGGKKRQSAAKYHRTLQSDGTFLTLRHAFGVAGGVRDSVAFVTVPDTDEHGGGLKIGYLVHPVGQQVAMYRVDDGSMKFLLCRQKSVSEILTLCVSPNKKVIAVCEKSRAPGGTDPGNAQVSVYHVATCKRIRTMLCPGKGDFVACCFSGDSRWLVTAAAEPDSSIVVWNWDKEKVEKIVQNNGFTVTRVTFNPGDRGFFVTSGSMHLRLWYASSDDFLKAHAILTHSKEQENFSDHTWAIGVASAAGQLTRMIAITNGESSSSSGAGHQRGSSIFVFDSIAGPPFLELKQTLQAPPPVTSRLEIIMPYSKGFIVAGGGINGFLGIYEDMGDHREPYMWTKGFTAKGAVLTDLTFNRISEIVYAYSRPNEILTFNLGNIDVLDDDRNHFSTLLQGGNHTAPVIALDVCLTRPIAVTLGEDRVLRVWNYLKWRCEVVHEFHNEDPNCAGLHPAGLQVAVGFKDRVRIFSVLIADLRVLRDIPQKNCRAVAYAHGGHLLAVASGFSVLVFNSITAQQVNNFTGHIAAITLMRWGPRDNILFSTGLDGNVYGWDLQTGGMIDDCVDLNRTSSYHAMELRLSTKREVANVVAVCGVDPVIREVTWGGNPPKEHTMRDVRLDTNKQDEAFHVTCMATSISGKNIFCGTSTGRVRVYEWPLPQELPPCFELPVHAGPVTILEVTPDENFIFTCGEDGCVFVLGIKMMERGIQIKGMENSDPRAFDIDTVLVSQEEIEEQHGQIEELNKTMEDMKIDHAFALHRKTTELLDDLKQVTQDNDGQLASKDKRFEELHQKHNALKKENAEELDKKDRRHVQVTQERESQYEHRLAMELDRFDRLSEEVEAVQQRCEGLLEAQQQEHQWELMAREKAAGKMEKELRQQIERLQEDKNYNDQMYREVLDQQEGEYETELQQLTTAADAEIHTERQNTGKLRAILQTRKTKEEQLRKKMQETQRSFSAREMMFALEKAKRERLEAIMHHFEQHMHERELTLAEKEKTILELRSNNTTLDNFRFVLDHRLQQLMEERGPITEHIEGLEAHIRGMYDELVSEFGEKKDGARVLEQKESKLVALTQEAKSLRSQVRSKDYIILAVKRELSSMVHISMPKELEQAVKDAYKKFVRGEKVMAKAYGTRASRPVGKDEREFKGGGRSGGGNSEKRGRDKRAGSRGKGGIGGSNTNIKAAGEAQAAAGMGSSLTVVGDDDAKAVGGDTNGEYDGSCDSAEFHWGVSGSGRRGRQGVDDAAELMAQKREAHKQCEFMEKKQNELATKLSDAKLFAVKKQRAKLYENRALISECNTLRKENNYIKRQNELLRIESKQTAAKLAQQQQQQQQRKFLKTHGGEDALQQGPMAPSTAGIGGLPSASGGGRANGGGGEARPYGSSEEQSRSIGDTTSITLLQAPETEVSFVSMPPPWKPTAVDGDRASVGAVNGSETGALHCSEPGFVKPESTRAEMVEGLKSLLDTTTTYGGGHNDNSLPKQRRQQPKEGEMEMDHAAGTGTAPEPMQQQQRRRYQPSASFNLLPHSSRHPWSILRQQLAHSRHQTLGKINAGKGTAKTRGRGPALTPVSGETGLVKGGTRGLYVQATLAGKMLSLEQALDDKERELLLQRGENNSLRERLRALEACHTNSIASAQSTTTTATTRRQSNTPLAVSSPPGYVNDDHTNVDRSLPPSVLAQTWGGSGRGGTAPYPNANGSRPVTPAAGWGVGQPGAGERSAGERIIAGLSAPPPGAHVPVLRGEVGGVVVPDQGLIIDASGVGSDQPRET